MRKSLLQHNVARLRLICGEKQSGFAELTKVKLKTLQKIETDKLGLSEEMARRIANATGIDVHWLLENDTKAQPVTVNGYVYTKRDFDAVQAANVRGEQEFVVQMLSDYQASFYGQIAAILLAAAKAREAETVVWKMGKLLAEVRREYGYNESSISDEPFATRGDGSLAMRRSHVEAGWNLMREHLAARDQQEAEIATFIASDKAKEDVVNPAEPTGRIGKSPRRAAGAKPGKAPISKPLPQSSRRPPKQQA